MKLFMCALLFCSLARGQAAMHQPGSTTVDDSSWVPRPYFLAGPSLVGNGYQTFAMRSGAGLLLRTRRLHGNFEAGYMNARKTNDATANNRNGHERFLQARLFYPWRRSLYFGGGGQWSQTATTNYTKSAWRPTFGLGGDHFAEDMSARWQVMYITPGTDHSNALQGPEFQLWIPSPASKSHFIWRMTLGIYEFHSSVTDPSDRKLTALQIRDRQHAAFLDFSFGWRF